ncbi:uncharacterized protein METZ01_LOCUS503549, partial [marine metagenome]
VTPTEPVDTPLVDATSGNRMKG